jgi:uncharacterized integral membrane protein
MSDEQRRASGPTAATDLTGVPADPSADLGAGPGADPGATVAVPPEHTPDVPETTRRPNGKIAKPGPSRISGMWIGLIFSALVLLFLLIFILQNLDAVAIHFLGANGTLPTGVALLLAAIAGVLLVAIPGSARIIQLRRTARRNAKRSL